MLPNLQESFEAARSKRMELRYRAAEPSQYRPDTRLIGGAADAHLWEYDVWRMRERMREIERDTPIVGQLLDRGVCQVLGSGLRVDPQTGSAKRNALLSDLWREWTETPDLCDFTGRMTFAEIERLALRQMWLDGDSFVLKDERSGSVLLEEGDRCTSAQNQWTINVDGQERDLVLGVELDGTTRKPLAYYFQRYKPGERQRIWRQVPQVTDERMVRIPSDQVLHVYRPRRATQTRGVTAFHPVLDRIYMLEDIEFADLVRQQVSSCIAAFVYSDYGPQWGAQTEENASDGSTLTVEEFSPGMVVQLPPGSKVEGFSPNVSTSDVREQAKQIVREVGLCIGLPLELSLMITSDTTFHGYRGVVEAYKVTARELRTWFSSKLRSSVYRWKVSQWIEEGLIPDRACCYRHTVHGPTWAYVDPEKDAKADEPRIKAHLASPRQVWAERGRDYEEGVREIAEDGAVKIAAAVKVADELEGAGVEGVTWRDVLSAGTGSDPKPATPQSTPLAAPESPEEPSEENDGGANDEQD